MNFSDCIDHLGSLVVYSPNGRMVAISKGFEIEVFDTVSLRPMQIFNFPDVASHLSWSTDSTLILVGLEKRGLIFAQNVFDPTWHSKIDTGMQGMQNCRFSPSGRHILTTNDFNLRLTIYSLIDQGMQFIERPKFAAKGLDFSTDGQLMALL